MKKKLSNEAEKEFLLITKHFKLYDKVLKYLGGISLGKRNYKEAICYFELLRQHPNYKTLQSEVLHDLGISYFHLSKFDKAEEFLLASNALQEKKQDTTLLVGSYNDIANLYYEQYKDSLAIPYFKKAYDFSLQTNSFELKKITAKNMAAVEENRKDLKKALQYRKEYEKWQDSLNNQNKVWSIAQLEKKHAVNQKQQHIQLLESENALKEIQRNGFIFSSGILLLFLSTGGYFYAQKIKANKIITNQKEELDALNTTKDKLLSVVSHDLRSSVNAIQYNNKRILRTIDNENYKVSKKTTLRNTEVTNSTHNLLNNLLHWASLQTHQLYFSVESVDLFSVVQQVSFDYTPLFEHNEITFSSSIPKATYVEVDLDSLKIVLRNLLDNAIKFSEKNGHISITSSSDETLHYLIVEDNGAGMSPDTIHALLKEEVLLSKKKNQKGVGTGLGIQLCKSMIKKNQGTFAIESEEGIGTKIIIGLPKNNLHG